MARRFLLQMAALMVCGSRFAHAAAPNAGCNLQIMANPAQWRVSGIDVFATEPTLASFDLDLVNTGSAPCSGRLAFDTEGAPFGLTSNGGHRVPYSLVDGSTGNDLTPRNGHSPPNSGKVLVVPPQGQILARFDVLFPNLFQTDGSYSQQLFVQLADPSDGTVAAQQMITLAADVPSSATIALSGDFTRVGGMADVDLGELSQGPVDVPLIIHVKSTRAYQITSSSENAGKLVLAGTGWSIPYSLSINGTAIDASGGIFHSSSGDNSRADNLSLGFVILGSTDVEAGRYSDVVTLDVALD